MYFKVDSVEFIHGMDVWCEKKRRMNDEDEACLLEQIKHTGEERTLELGQSGRVSMAGCVGPHLK